MVVVLTGLIAPYALGAHQAAQFENWTDEQKEDFLRSAKMTGFRELGIGITRSLKLTLAHNGATHDSHFQSIDEFKPIFQGTQGTETNFRDSDNFNIAAYKLDRLIGLNLVPVSVERKAKGERGAATWWIDDVQMMELKRKKKGITPPNQSDWNDQMYNI